MKPTKIQWKRFRNGLAAVALVMVTGCGGGGGGGHTPDFQTIKGDSTIVLEEAPKGAKGAAKAAPAAPINRADYKPLSFDTLAGYSYEFPNMDGKPLKPGEFKSQIPAKIKELDGKKIALKGFMIPLQFEDNGSKRFIISQFVPSCCFGDTIKMTQWIDVQMGDGKRSKVFSSEPIVVFGTLNVGEELENGYVSSLYRLKADEVLVLGQDKN